MLTGRRHPNKQFVGSVEYRTAARALSSKRFGYSPLMATVRASDDEDLAAAVTSVGTPTPNNPTMAVARHRQNRHKRPAGFLCLRIPDGLLMSYVFDDYKSCGLLRLFE